MEPLAQLYSPGFSCEYKVPRPHLPTWPCLSDSLSMSGPAWPGTLVPFPLSANTVSGKLGRLTTPPQRPIGHSQESHLGRELTVESTRYNDSKHLCSLGCLEQLPAMSQ